MGNACVAACQSSFLFLLHVCFLLCSSSGASNGVCGLIRPFQQMHVQHAQAQQCSSTGTHMSHHYVCTHYILQLQLPYTKHHWHTCKYVRCLLQAEPTCSIWETAAQLHGWGGQSPSATACIGWATHHLQASRAQSPSHLTTLSCCLVCIHLCLGLCSVFLVLLSLLSVLSFLSFFISFWSWVWSFPSGPECFLLNSSPSQSPGLGLQPSQSSLGLPFGHPLWLSGVDACSQTAFFLRENEHLTGINCALHSAVGVLCMHCLIGCWKHNFTRCTLRSNIMRPPLPAIELPAIASFAWAVSTLPMPHLQLESCVPVLPLPVPYPLPQVLSPASSSECRACSAGKAWQRSSLPRFLILAQSGCHTLNSSQPIPLACCFACWTLLSNTTCTNCAKSPRTMVRFQSKASADTLFFFLWPPFLNGDQTCSGKAQPDYCQQLREYINNSVHVQAERAVHMQQPIHTNTHNPQAQNTNAITHTENRHADLQTHMQTL